MKPEYKSKISEIFALPVDYINRPDNFTLTVNGEKVGQDFGESSTTIKITMETEAQVKFSVSNACGEDAVEFKLLPVGELESIN